MKNIENSQQKNNSASFHWFKRKHALQTGFLAGLVTGVSIIGGTGFAYLSLTQETVSVRDGKLLSNKESTTNIETTTTSLDVGGEDNIVGSGGNSLGGENSSLTGNIDEKANAVGNSSPSIVGSYNSVTIVSNQDLPGFDESSGFIAPPSDLSKYERSSDFQPDSFLRNSSDYQRLSFEEKTIVIKGLIYTSFFEVSPYANKSQFVFALEGGQQAALLQFGLPDITSGNATSTVYSVRIFADGKLLWAGECKRSQNSQIFSVPLEIPGAKSLIIEVGSNNQYNDPLYFTRAELLWN